MCLLPSSPSQVQARLPAPASPPARPHPAPPKRSLCSADLPSRSLVQAPELRSLQRQFLHSLLHPHHSSWIRSLRRMLLRSRRRPPMFLPALAALRAADLHKWLQLVPMRLAFRSKPTSSSTSLPSRILCKCRFDLPGPEVQALRRPISQPPSKRVLLNRRPLRSRVLNVGQR